jgi:hypothetical protein
MVVLYMAPNTNKKGLPEQQTYVTIVLAPHRLMAP